MVAFEVFHPELNHVESLTESFELSGISFNFECFCFLVDETKRLQNHLVDQTWVTDLTRFIDIVYPTFNAGLFEISKNIFEKISQLHRDFLLSVGSFAEEKFGKNSFEL